jgi:hypothetical protein
VIRASQPDFDTMMQSKLARVVIQNNRKGRLVGARAVLRVKRTKFLLCVCVCVSHKSVARDIVSLHKEHFNNLPSKPNQYGTIYGVTASSIVTANLKLLCNKNIAELDDPVELSEVRTAFFAALVQVGAVPLACCTQTLSVAAVVVATQITTGRSSVPVVGEDSDGNMVETSRTPESFEMRQSVYADKGPYIIMIEPNGQTSIASEDGKSYYNHNELDKPGE